MRSAMSRSDWIVSFLPSLRFRRAFSRAVLPFGWSTQSKRDTVHTCEKKARHHKIHFTAFKFKSCEKSNTFLNIIITKCTVYFYLRKKWRNVFLFQHNLVNKHFVICLPMPEANCNMLHSNG